MAIDKLTPLGESGTLESTSTFEDWVSGGFTSERVRTTRLNRQFNRVDNKINEIIEKSPHATASEDNFIRGLFPVDNAGALYDDGNVLTPAGAPSELRHMCYSKIDGTRVIIGVAPSELFIYDIDNWDEYETVPIATLEAGLDTSGTQTYQLLDVCTDGTNAYALFIDVDPANYEFHVQSYRLADWSVDPDWPQYGTQLATADTSISTYAYYRIRWASETQLFVVQPWVTVAAASDAAMSVLTADDGTLERVGAGFSAGTILDACSNGVYIFAAFADGSNNIGVTCVPISDLTSEISWLHGDDSLPTIADQYMGSMVCAGTTAVMTTRLTGGKTYVFNTTQGLTAEIYSGDPDMLDGLWTTCTDGLHFYAVGWRERTGTSSDVPMLFRLDPVDYAGFHTNGFPYYEALNTAEVSVRPFRISTDKDPDYSDPHIPIIADGDSVWIFFDEKLRRLRRAGSR